MLHILWLILCIIGIILLVILLLLIGVMLLLLFVPVRYKGKGSYDKKLEGVFSMTWLFHLISVTIHVKETTELTVRLLGIRLKKKEKDITEELEEEPMVVAQELTSPFIAPEEIREETREEERIPLGRPLKRPLKHPLRRKEKFFSRLFYKVKKFWEKIKNIGMNIMDKFSQLIKTWENVTDFLEDEENKKTFRLIKKELKRAVRYLFPKLKGTISFGFEDPYYTGRVLTWAAFFYPFYRGKLILYPVFDRQFLEGTVTIRGRVRMGKLLMIAVRLWSNRNFRKKIRQFLG